MGAVPVGFLWFGLIAHADAQLPHGAARIAAAVALVAFATLAEELVFRGVLLDALTRARVTGDRSRLRAESAGANVMASAAYAAACLGWPMPYPILAFVAALVLGTHGAAPAFHHRRRARPPRRLVGRHLRRTRPVRRLGLGIPAVTARGTHGGARRLLPRRPRRDARQRGREPCRDEQAALLRQGRRPSSAPRATTVCVEPTSRT